MRSSRGRGRRGVALAAGWAIAVTAVLGSGPAIAGKPPARDDDQPGKANQLQHWADAEVDRPGEQVTVEILLDPNVPNAAAVAADVARTAGGRVTGEVPGHLLQIDVAPAALDALRRAPGVQSVRRPLPQNYPLDRSRGIGPLVQATIGEEIAHTNAGAWHAAGHTGAGVRIGIVDGFDGAVWDTAAAQGDLPDEPAGTFCKLRGNDCNIWDFGIAHGVAVAELVDEMAPDAELFVATAETASDLQAAVDWFIDNGVTIVNRSLGAPLDGPGDGTRSPLTAVADAAAQAGIAWFNSAGNEAGRDGTTGNYYRAEFTDADGDGWHEFVDPAGAPVAGGPFEDLGMVCDGLTLSSLRWDDWDDIANASDYDLYVFDQPGVYDDFPLDANPHMLDAGTAWQGPGDEGGAPPLEHLAGRPCASGETVFLAIHAYAANGGTTGDVVEVMAESDIELWSNPYSAGYPIVDSTHSGVFGIGAVDGDHTVADYSSEGPTNDGRTKPDFTARSGVQTVGLPSFHGTSASSPIAAGIAALVVGAGRAGSPADLRTWLLANASAERGPCGPDNTYGYGELVLPDPNAPAGTYDPYLACAARFTPLAPTRIFDSRPDQAAPGPKGKLTAESQVDVQVAGAASIPADASAVVLNVTTTETEGPGYVTAYPSGTSRPVASAVNVMRAGQTRAALVTVPLGTNGAVTLFTKNAAHLIADVAGYYVGVAGQPTAAGRFVALTPQRLFDTRPSEPAPGPKGPLGARQQIDVTVPGQANVPTTGVSAVVLNLTGTQADAPGYLTVFPTGSPVPTASNVNLGAAGATAPNLAIVPLGAGGQISVYSSHGSHALADVVGYITDDTAPVESIGLFVPVAPTRVFDTRPDSAAPGPKGALPPDSTVYPAIAGTFGIPGQATAVVLSVTGVDSPPGYVTVWDGTDRPVASTLNFAEQPLDTRANGAMLGIGADGHLGVYSKNGGHVIADATGFFLW